MAKNATHIEEETRMQSATVNQRNLLGAYVKAIAIARGSLPAALAYAQGQAQLANQSQLVSALKAAVAGMGSDTDILVNPVAEAFTSVVRDFSIPLRLPLREVPMFTRIFENASAAAAVRVAEGASIPVVRGNFGTVLLTQKRHGGIVIETEELPQSTSPVAGQAIVADLAPAVAEAENLSFAGPNEAGSIFFDAPHFNGAGSTLANCDSDLKRLVDQVPGAKNPGATFLMCQETATYLSLIRGSGGAAAFPAITPQGGSLLGLPVLITSAMQLSGSPITRCIGLVDPSQVFWADEGVVQLMVSSVAALQQSDAPTQNSLTPTATTQVSMFQTSAVAIRAIRESSWHARAGSGSYFVSGY
jgi:HK97 family phage major capsid protein